jgi:hypothetical protein
MASSLFVAALPPSRRCAHHRRLCVQTQVMDYIVGFKGDDDLSTSLSTTLD